MAVVITHSNGTQPEDTEAIWVFGSNLAGYHGAGAALVAVQRYGAEYGNPFGPQGRSWAIPTKNMRIKTLPLHVVEFYVNAFIDATKLETTPKKYFITAIGCGLAGYKTKNIAPMFKPILTIEQHVYSVPSHWLEHWSI